MAGKLLPRCKLPSKASVRVCGVGGKHGEEEVRATATATAGATGTGTGSSALPSPQLCIKVLLVAQKLERHGDRAQCNYSCCCCCCTWHTGAHAPAMVQRKVHAAGGGVVHALPELVAAADK